MAGRAGAGLSLTLSYDQSLAALGAAGDRFGLGAGWTLGVPWVNTAGGVHVYPASGGSYAYDASSPTGLADYPLRDLTFVKNPGDPASARACAVRQYVYTLTYLGGTVRPVRRQRQPDRADGPVRQRDRPDLAAVRVLVAARSR